MSTIDRIRYIAEMKALLSFMDAKDRNTVLRYYEECFDDVGYEGEEELIASMGSPVRQVLLVEKEYRERQEAGLPGTGFEREYAPLEEPVAQEESTEPLNVEEWSEPAAAEEDVQSFEPMEEIETAAEPEYADTRAVVEAAINAFMPPEEPPEVSVEMEEVLIPMEIEEEPRKPKKRQPAKPVTEEEEEPAPAGRVVGAVFLTIPMIALAAVGVALSAAVSIIGFLPGAFFGAAAVYLALYALTGMNFLLPDKLLVLGAALVALAAGLLFLWLGVWLLVEGIALTIRVISRIYGAVLRGGANDE